MIECTRLSAAVNRILETLAAVIDAKLLQMTINTSIRFYNKGNSSSTIITTSTHEPLISYYVIAYLKKCLILFYVIIKVKNVKLNSQCSRTSGIIFRSNIVFVYLKISMHRFFTK